jgi:hypothetical protein
VSPAVKVERLDRRERRAMRAALVRGEPLGLSLWHAPPPEVRLDDVVPLCHAVETWDRQLTASLRALLPPGARHGCPAKVTAIVPTHRRVPLGLVALAGQDVAVEILVVDNAPTPLAGPDLTLARVLRLPWEGHGRTRQRAVEQASGDYVFFTVDDAIPCGAGFLRTLVEALDEGGYDAVTARQLPWPDSDPVTARSLRAWTPPGARHRPVGFLDHVAALHRRATLLAHPLPDVPIAEDLHWGRGRRLGYEPRACVVHAHERRPVELFRRARAIHAQHLALGEPARIGHLGAVLGALPGLVRPVLAGGPREILNQGAELLGQWAAARAARG